VTTDPADTAVQLYATWNDEGLDAVAERFWAEEIEWRDDPQVPDADVHRGRDHVRSHIEDRVAALGNFDIEVERVLEAGESSVLAVYTFRGQGGQSGAPYEMRIAQLLTMEAGRVIAVQDYLDAEVAMSTLGDL
jgi:ketosteroid isomerase-like protein